MSDIVILFYCSLDTFELLQAKLSPGAQLFENSLIFLSIVLTIY